MGYYIDQLAEQERQKRLADLLIAGEAGSFPAFMPPPDYSGERTLGNYPAPQQPDIRQQYAKPLMDTLADMRATSLSDYPAPQQPESLAPQQTMAQFFANPQPPRNPIYDQPEDVDRPGVVMQAAPNTIRNNTTGKVTQLPISGVSGMGGVGGSPAIDMSQNPVKTPYGTGYYLKGDSTRMLIPATGQIVDLGRDTAAERVRTKENLALDKTRAEIAQITAKPTSEYDKAIAQERARRDIMASMPPAMREAEEVKRLGIKLKPGERYNMEKGEVELIPGSEPYKKMEKEVVEKATGLGALDRVIGRMTSIVADIEKSPGKDAAVGMFDAWSPVIASLTPQDKADARSKIKNLQEYLQTRGLADLRASGVAPGSVTEKEWGKFAAMIANVDPSMSEKEFDKELSNLKTMAASYGAEAANRKEAYAKQYGSMWAKYAGGPQNPPAAPSTTAPKLTNADSEAMAWAMKNPYDPRATKIKERLGVK